MIKKADRNVRRKQRHVRVRGKVNGCSERPRLCVYRSSKNIYAQLIDDVNGHTLCSASSVEKDFNGGANVEAAREVGKKLAERAKTLGIENVVFDRGGYLYHGRVKALAEGAREAGLQF